MVRRLVIRMGVLRRRVGPGVVQRSLEHRDLLAHAVPLRVARGGRVGPQVLDVGLEAALYGPHDGLLRDPVVLVVAQLGQVGLDGREAAPPARPLHLLLRELQLHDGRRLAELGEDGSELLGQQRLDARLEARRGRHGRLREARRRRQLSDLRLQGVQLAAHLVAVAARDHVSP